jgi:hypothetical protein
VIGFITDRELRARHRVHPSSPLTCHMLSFGIQSERIFYPSPLFYTCGRRMVIVIYRFDYKRLRMIPPLTPQATSTWMFLNSNVNSNRLIGVNFWTGLPFFLLPCRWWLMRLIQIVLHTRERSGLQVDSTPIGWINRRTNRRRSCREFFFPPMFVVAPLL